jgi:chromosome segregation ATPase
MVTPDVERLERMAAADPFGAAEEAQEKLLPALASARAAMEAKRAEKAAAEGDLAGARQELKALNALCQDADAAATTCASKVKDIVLPQPDPASARELPVWLDRLEARLVEGRMEAFRVGLDRWRELLAAERGARETLMSAAKAALARREELRGRFTALKAKHAALAAAGTLPDGADDAASKLSGILFGTATPLQEAERLMTEYETILARSRRVG